MIGTASLTLGSGSLAALATPSRQTSTIQTSADQISLFLLIALSKYVSLKYQINMRNFVLKNPALVKTTFQGKPSVYFVADAVNPEDWFDTLGKVNIFDDQYNHVFIEEIKKYFSKENGGTADVDSEIPEQLLIFKNASKLEVPFIEPMVLCYGKDEDGHKAGEPMLNRNGDYYVKSSVMVTVKKPIGAKDEDNQWIAGWSPNQRRDQLMNRFYRPLREFNSNISSEEPPMPE